MLRIEKNAPPPRAKSGHKKYPWALMETGDSFLVRATTRSEKYRLASSLSAGAVRQGAKLDVKFSVGLVAEGVRVWRTR